ncbi:RNA polymerase I associated factor, A49-like protein [Calycina marina]|uniref:RNA polymerase I associated factor, A49-like protein n=1 Tax=Calycina marina TaxID=1763456 RepID=A0A9P8CG38_9HELO|nr:RNA polymerase I associated factor, A49-like protein [Calycina marina]
MAEKIDKGKKRKRASNDFSKPSKKLALDPSKPIKISFPETDKWAPIIASTTGIDMPAIPLHPYTKARERDAQTVGNRAIDSTEFLLHSNVHPKIDYTAREEESGTTNALRKHYVGIFDPETGSLQVVESRKMIVRGVVRAHAALNSDDEVMESRRVQRNEQVQAFGTKKAKKALASQTENAIGPARLAGSKAVKVDRAAAATLASMADAAASMPSKDQLAQAADAAKPRPKANPVATEIKDVYTIDSLIGNDIFKYVEVLDWQQASKKRQEIRVSSAWVAKRIEKCASKVEKLKVLRYLQLLIDFYKYSKPIGRGRTRKLAKPADLRKEVGAIAENVLESVKKRFSTSGEIDPFHVDLLITHMAALACLIDNYEVDMWDLRHDLDLETRKMQQYFQEIGARMRAMPEVMRKALDLEKSAAAQRKVAKLLLPLEFPKVPFGRTAR